MALMNEKNLEKGLGVDSVDKDAVNAAISRSSRLSPSTSPKEAAPAQGRSPGVPWPPGDVGLSRRPGRETSPAAVV